MLLLFFAFDDDDAIEDDVIADDVEDAPTAWAKVDESVLPEANDAGDEAIIELGGRTTRLSLSSPPPRLGIAFRILALSGLLTP